MHKSGSLLKGISVLTALVLCAGSALGQKWGDVTDEEWAIGPPPEYSEANAMVLFDKGHVEITKSNIRIDYHVRMKVLTAAGIEEVGDQSISAHKEYDKIKDFKAQTITPGGKKIKVEKDAIFEKTAGDYEERTFTFPSVSVGCIIEYKYAVVSERFYYLRPWYFQNSIYTSKSELSVTIPNGFTYTVQYQNVPPQFREPSLEEKIDVDAGYSGAKIRTFTWTRENLPPITDEPYMSALDDYRSGLRFQLQLYEDRYNYVNFQKTWPERGAVCQNWLDEYCNKDGDIRKLAEEITAGLTSPEEKSRAIYDYVTANYKSRKEYHNWYFMHDRMENLLTDKFGSPEGKNVLLCRLHKAAGMPAFPVLISRRSNGHFYPDFAYLPQFDYMIAFVQLGNDYEFLDASSKFAPYGVLPPDCLVEGGLLIDGENSQLVRLRDKTLYSGRTDRTRIHLASDSPAVCTTSCNFRGYYASLYGRRYEDNDPDDFIKDYFVDRIGLDMTVGDYKCLLDTAHEFVMTVDYSSDDIAEVLDNNLLVKLISFAYRDNPFKSLKRFFPVDFQYPFTYRNVMEVVVDGDVQQSVLPEDITLFCGGATFERKSSVVDSVVVIDSKLIIEKPQFLPNQYTELRDFFDKVALSSEDELAFVLTGAE